MDRPDDANLIGASTRINYTAINKLPPLRSGEISPDQSVSMASSVWVSAAEVTGTSRSMNPLHPATGQTTRWPAGTSTSSPVGRHSFTRSEMGTIAFRSRHRHYR